VEDVLEDVDFEEGGEGRGMVGDEPDIEENVIDGLDLRREEREALMKERETILF
jgi:hypothetical protein